MNSRSKSMFWWWTMPQSMCMVNAPNLGDLSSWPVEFAVSPARQEWPFPHHESHKKFQICRMGNRPSAKNLGNGKEHGNALQAWNGKKMEKWQNNGSGFFRRTLGFPFHKWPWCSSGAPKSDLGKLDLIETYACTYHWVLSYLNQFWRNSFPCLKKWIT